MKPFEYINRTYGTNACIGKRVCVGGRTGTITEDMGHYIGVNFDHDKPGVARPCHPTSEVIYLNDIVKPRKMTRSQRRYREFLDCDFGQSFAEWLGIGRAR